MYVDKRFAGIQAVQTLSRLNRIHPLKEETFILDFVNDRQEIQEAFKQYYDGAEMGEEVAPARLTNSKRSWTHQGFTLPKKFSDSVTCFSNQKSGKASLIIRR
jgi:type I restriction enzyme, R subunit